MVAIPHFDIDAAQRCPVKYRRSGWRHPDGVTTMDSYGLSPNCMLQIELGTALTAQSLTIGSVSSGYQRIDLECVAKNGDQPPKNRQMIASSLRRPVSSLLGGHPKPAIGGHLKTGQ
jgi:hypothetical protein